MAALYGSLTGRAKSEATRCGSKNNPVSAHVRGWNFGVKTTAYLSETGVETVEVYLTAGSSGAGSSVYLGRFTRAEYDEMVAAEKARYLVERGVSA